MGGNALMIVLRDIHDKPRRLQSDFCRTYAYEVARLASLGLITTRLLDVYGHHWRCTFKGLRLLELGDPE